MGPQFGFAGSEKAKFIQRVPVQAALEFALPSALDFFVSTDFL
jgi:hypothetical protein